MNDLPDVVAKWFSCWNTGNIDELPIADDFSHTSPFGTIEPKARYMEIVNKNRAAFLGNKLSILKTIQEGNNVCVQFRQSREDSDMDMIVCEWYFIENGLISEIRSFYNIGNAEITA